MTLRAQQFSSRSRTGGATEPDWEVTHSLAADGYDQGLYILVSWTGLPPGYTQGPSSKRIELADFVEAPSEERDGLFGLMHRLLPGTV